jgi:hypothetical protein
VPLCVTLAAWSFQHDHSWFRLPSTHKTIIFLSPDSYMFGNGAPLRRDEGSEYYWTLSLYCGVTLLMLSHSFTPRLSLTPLTPHSGFVGQSVKLLLVSTAR